MNDTRRIVLRPYNRLYHDIMVWNRVKEKKIEIKHWQWRQCFLFTVSFAEPVFGSCWQDFPWKHLGKTGTRFGREITDTECFQPVCFLWFCWHFGSWKCNTGQEKVFFFFKSSLKKKKKNSLAKFGTSDTVAKFLHFNNSSFFLFSTRWHQSTNIMFQSTYPNIPFPLERFKRILTGSLALFLKPWPWSTQTVMRPWINSLKSLQLR